MRITTNAYRDHFLKNTNSALENQLKIIDRIQTQRKYNRASEDSVSAAKAAHVRKSLENLDIYDNNAKTAQELFKGAEESLYDIANSTYLNIQEKLLSAQDTKSQTEFDILAQEIDQMAEHIMSDMNLDFAERQMFGALSNDKTPFTAYAGVKVTGADGTVYNFGSLAATGDEATSKVVCYNDIPVNMEGADLINAVKGGTVEYYDENGTLVETKTINSTPSAAALGTADDFPGAGHIYVDIGLGINYDPKKIDSTALDISLNGVKFTGCGTDDEGDTQNIIQMVFDAATALKNGDLDEANKYIDKLEAARGTVLNSITDLGIQQINLDFILNKNETYRLSLSEKQNDLEGADLTEEITNWKSAEAAYNATLAMGTSSLPKSLFDFI
ncbi:MAG: hypothetical protein ACI4KF_10775 [Huintestinicola sp.]